MLGVGRVVAQLVRFGQRHFGATVACPAPRQVRRRLVATPPRNGVEVAVGYDGVVRPDDPHEEPVAEVARRDGDRATDETVADRDRLPVELATAGVRGDEGVWAGRHVEERGPTAGVGVAGSGVVLVTFGGRGGRGVCGSALQLNADARRTVGPGGTEFHQHSAPLLELETERWRRRAVHDRHARFVGTVLVLLAAFGADAPLAGTQADARVRRRPVRAGRVVLLPAEPPDDVRLLSGSPVRHRHLDGQVVAHCAHDVHVGARADVVPEVPASGAIELPSGVIDVDPVGAVREPFAPERTGRVGHRTPGERFVPAELPDPLAQLAAKALLLVVGRREVDLRRILLRARRHLHACDSTSLWVEDVSGDRAASARDRAEVADVDRREEVARRTAWTLPFASVVGRAAGRLGAGRGGSVRCAADVVGIRPRPAPDRDPHGDSRCRAERDTEDEGQDAGHGGHLMLPPGDPPARQA
ncbi:MAG: hypothetical protein K8T90_07010 [Planctomycetes bacterium]|nr:hypothetical protein [Planctomycetota bacterium]